jgi:hypothetical protein
VDDYSDDSSCTLADTAANPTHADLVSKISHLTTQLTTLQQSSASDLMHLSKKLVAEASRRMEAELSLKKLEHELEDLSRAVFEEANIMVAKEARARWEVQKENESLQQKLVETQELLEVANEEILGLKKTVQLVGSELEKFSSLYNGIESANVLSSSSFLNKALHTKKSVLAHPTSPLESPMDIEHTSTTDVSSLSILNSPNPLIINTKDLSLEPQSLSADHYRKEITHLEVEGLSALKDPYKSISSPLVLDTTKLQERDSGIFSDDISSCSSRSSSPAHKRHAGLKFELQTPPLSPLMHDCDQSEVSGHCDNRPSSDCVRAKALPDKTAFMFQQPDSVQLQSLRFSEFKEFLSMASQGQTKLPKLMSTKFIKRTVAEDVNPTLPLEFTTWFGGRQLKQAVMENSVVLFKLKQNVDKLRVSSVQCESCDSTIHLKSGAAPGSDVYLYYYQLDPSYNTQESPDGTCERQPICKLCHTRLQSCCEFWHFVRLCHQGYFNHTSSSSESVQGLTLSQHPIQQQLVQPFESIERVWIEYLGLKVKMCLARCGVCFDDE